MLPLTILFALAYLCSSAFAQELVFPLTARLQSQITDGGVPAESYFLSGNVEVSCFEATPAGSRFLCLSGTGTIVEWTADNKIRKFAEGFFGPLQAKAAPDGTLYVLDSGRGTLSQVAPDGTVARLMGAGTDRVIRQRMDPRTFDLPLFTISRDNYSNSVKLAIDPAGNPYLGILREEIIRENENETVRRLLYIFRFENQVTSMVLHWDGTATLDGETSELDALSVDKDRNIFFSTDGRVSRLDSSMRHTALVDGRYTVLNSNPVRAIVQTDDGNIFLHSPSSANLFRLAFVESRIELDSFATLSGRIARQGSQLIGLDLDEKRLLRYVPDPVKAFLPQELSRLLRYIPITGNIAFRAAFDNPVSVTTDNQGQVYVVEGGEGSVYRIASNGAVQRIARSIYNPDSPPTGRVTSENVSIDALPYPVVAVANDREGRLYMLDRACNFFIQTSPTVARRASEFPAIGNCSEATLIADQARQIHAIFPTQGEVHTGTGDPLSGAWPFNRITTGGRIRSAALLPSGDLLLLGGPNAGAWTMRRLNTFTEAFVPIRVDSSLRGNVNLRIASIAVDFGGHILAVTCCTGGASARSGLPFLFNLRITGNNTLAGQARPVTYFDGPGQTPESLFSHPRGVLIKTNQSRLYYFEDPQFRPTSTLSLPNRHTWTYLPNSGLQELAIPVSPGFGPTAFRSRITCDRLGAFIRLGPYAAVAPTQLRLALDTMAAPSRSASCTIELIAVDTARVMATTTVDLRPDPVRLAQIPFFSVLEQLTPFKVDPGQATVTKTVRVINNSTENRLIRMEGTLPPGISFRPLTLALSPKQSGDFIFTIVRATLTRQHYQIPLTASCTACAQPVNMNLSFQLTGRTTSIDITAEAVSVDLAALNARNAGKLPATSIILSGLDESDVVVKTDLGTAPVWYALQKSSARRTEDGKLVVSYDLVLDRTNLPAKRAGSVVTFETKVPQGVARRFLTVFYSPEESPAQPLFESGEAGSTIDLGSIPTATITIPVFSRSAEPMAFSTYTLADESGKVSVPSEQGVVARGVNEIVLQVTRAAEAADGPPEEKDIVVLFANGEKLLYHLNVIASAQEATALSKSSERAIGKCAGILLLAAKEPGLPFAVVRNVGLRFMLDVKDQCNQPINVADKGTVIFTPEPANGTVTVTSVGNGLWEVFWKPERSGENISVKIKAIRALSEKDIYGGELTLNGRVTDSAIPGLRSFSIVDAVSFEAKSITAPGALITIYGENLAIESRSGFDKPGEFPLELGGVGVDVNGTPAPLLYVSPGQVNLQVPYDVDTSEYRMIVRRGDEVSAPSSLGVGSASPAIATLAQTGAGPGYVYRLSPSGPNGLATPDNPARRSEAILIMTTGLGATNPFFDEGKAVPSDNTLSVTGEIEVFIGTQRATNAKAYLAPGQIGIYFVTADVPAAAPQRNDVNVLVRVNGIDSQIVTMAIR